MAMAVEAAELVCSTRDQLMHVRELASLQAHVHASSWSNLAAWHVAQVLSQLPLVGRAAVAN